MPWRPSVGHVSNPSMGRHPQDSCAPGMRRPPFTDGCWEPGVAVGSAPETAAIPGVGVQPHERRRAGWDRLTDWPRMRRRRSIDLRFARGCGVVVWLTGIRARPRLTCVGSPRPAGRVLCEARDLSAAARSAAILHGGRRDYTFGTEPRQCEKTCASRVRPAAFALVGVAPAGSRELRVKSSLTSASNIRTSFAASLCGSHSVTAC